VEAVDIIDQERASEMERNMRILDAVEALELADQKREDIIGRMIKLARAKGRHLHDDYYIYGGFMIYVAGRCIRYWRIRKRTEKCVDADIVLNAAGNRWWRSLSISDCKGNVELNDQHKPVIKERYGIWPDYPYTDTVHVLSDAGTGIMTSISVHFDRNRSVLYERDEATGEYKINNETGEALSHLGLPDDLLKAKYVQGIPIRDMLEIDFAAEARRIEEYAELDEVVKAVGTGGR